MGAAEAQYGRCHLVGHDVRLLVGALLGPRRDSNAWALKTHSPIEAGYQKDPEFVVNEPGIATLGC